MLKKIAQNTFRILIALAVLKGTPVQAEAMEYIKNYVPQAQAVGEGRLRVFFLDVYDAKLFAPRGDWNEGEPLALQLTYLREISGKKIADRSAEEMRDLGINDEVKLATWHSQMREIFPDVDEGTVITGILAKNGETFFFKDGKQIGHIKDREFGRAFFDIWLDQQTSVPDLRRKLLGAL